MNSEGQKVLLKLAIAVAMEWQQERRQLKEETKRYVTGINSYCAIGYFRELSPAIFWSPQNIIKHALYGILALYTSINDAGIELSSRVIC